MQENMYKNEVSWNFRCGQGKIPPCPPDRVMLGIIPVTSEHLQRLVWSKLRELSILQGWTCLEGPGMKGEKASVALSSYKEP